jgi:hypothetical protein
LQAASPCDIKVIEDHMNLDVIDEAEDTLTILKSYIQNLEFGGDKNKVERVLDELYRGH